MNDKLTLHSIFRYLVGDDNFLLETIKINNNHDSDSDGSENNNSEKKVSNKKLNGGFDIMSHIVTEYYQMPPFDTQSCTMFPNKIKEILQLSYMKKSDIECFRIGIKNVIERNMTYINISFLNSFNFLLRPEISSMNLDDQIKNFSLLENFIKHKLQLNCGIDKINNTKKMKKINKERIQNIIDGKITHDIIQFIVNVFEVNLIVFDLVKQDVFFYWCKGVKFPYFNVFKKLYLMSYIQGNYEPIIVKIPENINDDHHSALIYSHVLTNTEDFIIQNEIKLNTITMSIINEWNLPIAKYYKIIDTYFSKSIIKEISINYYQNEKIIENKKLKYR